jgi:hypothetical protein
MTKLRVEIIEYADAFSIDIVNVETATRKQYYFDQEDPKISLVNVFNALNIPDLTVTYEEGY